LGCTVLALLLAAPGSARAVQLRTAGVLAVPPQTPVIPVSTDPVVQRVLNDELHGGSAAGQARTPVTLTVTLETHALGPGMSVSDLAPGDPEVAGLLRRMGINVPVLAEVQGEGVDPYAAIAKREALAPNMSAMDQIRNAGANGQVPLGPGGPMSALSMMPFGSMQPSYGAASGPRQAQATLGTVLVSQAVLSTGGRPLTIVALLNPDDDVREAKKLIASNIVSAVLRSGSP
jgi:hypothetical protein